MGTLIIFIGILYSTFQQQNHDNLDYELTKSINMSRLQLSSAIKDSYETFEKNKSYFTTIHQTAIDEFKKDENISLMKLKNKLETRFHLHDIDLDIYIINKEYVITDATFEKDIGLDFKNLFGGKEYFDNISKDNDIHIENDVLIDYMDSTLSKSIHVQVYIMISFCNCPFLILPSIKNYVRVSKIYPCIQTILSAFFVSQKHLLMKKSMKTS